MPTKDFDAETQERSRDERAFTYHGATFHLRGAITFELLDKLANRADPDGEIVQLRVSELPTIAAEFVDDDEYEAFLAVVKADSPQKMTRFIEWAKAELIDKVRDATGRPTNPSEPSTLSDGTQSGETGSTAGSVSPPAVDLMPSREAAISATG